MDIFPIHDQLILEPVQKVDERFGVGRVIRHGRGIATMNAFHPVIVVKGDEVVYLTEKALIFSDPKQEGKLLVLVSERDTSAVLGRDPYDSDIPGWDGFTEEEMDNIIDKALSEVAEEPEKESLTEDEE